MSPQISVRCLMPLASTIAVLTLCSLAHAQTGTAAISLTGGSVAGNVRQANTIGYAFTANAALTVSALGFYDAGQDGLSNTHDIGIFDSTGALRASATIQSGTVAPLIAQFRYVSITPVILTAGDYNLGAFYRLGDADNLLVLGQNLTTPPQITFQGSRFLQSTSLVNPTSPGEAGFAPAYFGPNFLFSAAPAAAAPEPGTTALLLIAGVPIIGTVRRRKATR